METLNGPNLIALSGNPVISLRGFLTPAADISIEPGVPVYIDGVYQPIISGSMSDLLDVERIEVLRGPQEWRTRQDSNLWPLPSEGSALSS